MNRSLATVSYVHGMISSSLQLSFLVISMCKIHKRHMHMKKENWYTKHVTVTHIQWQLIVGSNAYRVKRRIWIWRVDNLFVHSTFVYSFIHWINKNDLFFQEEVNNVTKLIFSSRSRECVGIQREWKCHSLSVEAFFSVFLLMFWVKLLNFPSSCRKPWKETEKQKRYKNTKRGTHAELCKGRLNCTE